MKVLGLDFTSAPSARKPITLARCTLDGTTLILEGVEPLVDFAGFEAMLAEPGPWIAGLDFPFGQARRFLETAGWPMEWTAYVERARKMGRNRFQGELENYKRHRPAGDKHHKRTVDVLAKSQSPQTLYGTPVGKMWFEGASRLCASSVSIPLLKNGDPDRLIVEAYPGIFVRNICPGAPYKGGKRTDAGRRAMREAIVAALDGPATREIYGVQVKLDASLRLALVEDRHGDALDAVLCAVQAAWAACQPRYGIPAGADPVEGWISDPHLMEAVAA
jgi:hypothetical protein